MKRTDLALEARELWGENAGEGTLPPGVTGREETLSGCRVETMTVTSPEGAEALGKPMGTYITVTPEAFLRREEGAFEAASLLLGKLLGQLLQSSNLPAPPTSVTSPPWPASSSAQVTVLAAPHFELLLYVSVCAS